MAEKLSKEHIEIILGDVTTLISTLHLMEKNDRIEKEDITIRQTLENYQQRLLDRLRNAPTMAEILKQDSDKENSK